MPTGSSTRDLHMHAVQPVALFFSSFAQFCTSSWCLWHCRQSLVEPHVAVWFFVHAILARPSHKKKRKQHIHWGKNNAGQRPAERLKIVD